jgi:hypothetical protein
MKSAESVIKAWVVFLTVLLLASAPAFCQEVTKLSKSEVKEMLGNPGLIIVDLRHSGDLKVQGAVREDPGNVASWMGRYDVDKALVFYCA